MKKVLALVLALIMVCTMAMAVTPSSFTYELDIEGFTLMTMNNVKVKVTAEKAKVTETAPVVVTSGDDETTTYYANKLVIDGVTYYACDKSIAQYKVASGTDVVAYLTKADLSKGATKVVDALHDAAEEPGCGDYAVKTYEIDGKFYVVGGKNLAVLDDNGLFVTYGDEAKAVAHSFAKKAYTYNEKGKIDSIKCDDCAHVFTVVEKVEADYAGDVNASLIPGYFVKGLAETAPATTTTTNPDTGANDVIGVAAALAVVALVSGAAISLKK